MDIKNLVIGGLVGLVVLFGGMYTLRPEVPPQDNQGNLGAVASPDIPSPYLNWGGVRMYNSGTPLTQAATTTCSIQNPTGATSTLVFGAIHYSFASSSATIVEIGKALGPMSTSTLLSGTVNIGAGLGLTIIASTTSTTGDRMIFGPNEWFNVKMAGTGGSAGLAPLGRCQAMWMAFPVL